MDGPPAAEGCCHCLCECLPQPPLWDFSLPTLGGKAEALKCHTLARTHVVPEDLGTARAFSVLSHSECGRQRALGGREDRPRDRGHRCSATGPGPAALTYLGSSFIWVLPGSIAAFSPAIPQAPGVRKGRRGGQVGAGGQGGLPGPGWGASRIAESSPLPLSLLELPGPTFYLRVHPGGI